MLHRLLAYTGLHEQLLRYCDILTKFTVGLQYWDWNLFDVSVSEYGFWV